jgi:hypothetical protein
VRGTIITVIVAAGIACSALAGGCSKKDVNQEVVAEVNGEAIRVLELREYLGVPAGVFALPSLPVEQKKRAVDQIVAGRLLVQEGRTLGLDNTPEYKGTVQRNETGVRINALFRKEASEKLKLDDKEVKAEAAKIKKENAGVSEADATDRASKVIIDRQVRTIQKDLVATAKKETGAAVDNAVMEKIGKGVTLPDNAVLASAGDEKILYGEVKKIIKEMPMLPVQPGQQSLQMTVALITRILDQELTLRALTAYSRKRGVDGSEWYRTARLNMERVVIANMVYDKVSLKEPRVTDEEVAADYAQRAKMMEGEKQKAPPLAAVKEQLRELLKNEKRRGAFEAYIGDLRKKAKVTVNDAVLTKI